MARIDLVEDYAVRLARESVRDSLMSHGEEAIVLPMYHPNKDDKIVPRCVCFDDIYKQSETFTCSLCYGTTFQGGIEQAYRVWCMFGDTPKDEEIDKKGVWVPDTRTIQTEGKPLVMDHDFVIRVSEWSIDHKALAIEGVYEIQTTDRRSLRTGNRFGQSRFDIVGQKSKAVLLADGQHPITKFPALGQRFDRYDNHPR